MLVEDELVQLRRWTEAIDADLPPRKPNVPEFGRIRSWLRRWFRGEGRRWVWYDAEWEKFRRDVLRRHHV